MEAFIVLSISFDSAFDLLFSCMWLIRPVGPLAGPTSMLKKICHGLRSQLNDYLNTSNNPTLLQ